MSNQPAKTQERLSNLWLVIYLWRASRGFFIVEAKTERTAKIIARRVFDEMTGYDMRHHRIDIFNDEVGAASISPLSHERVWLLHE